MQHQPQQGQHHLSDFEKDEHRITTGSNRELFSLVPIRSYGHHGPAVRRGLKFCGEFSNSARHISINKLQRMGRLNLDPSQNVRGAYNKVRILSGQCRLWTNNFLMLYEMTSEVHIIDKICLYAS